MGKDSYNDDLGHRKPGLLKDQVQLVKRKDSNRYEIALISDNLSFEKGFFVVVRACQLLAQKNDGLILIGVAGPSGAGKTVFTEKMLSFMPSIAVISMDNYNDASRIIDGNFDGLSSRIDLRVVEKLANRDRQWTNRKLAIVLCFKRYTRG
ncbi:Inorganic pyrophosphatase ttm2 [Castilleja foliolosa]|uniref:Inorganic pyrophosphatase ttm2 n=1 Tax=Castilleja foliolosa TaxID=1961234 RepID=A0ABD3DT11_9LAMI